ALRQILLQSVLVKRLQLRAGEIMRQNLAVRVAAISHHRRADLAQPDAVAPARADQREGLRIFCRAGFGLDYESRAVEVRTRQRAANLKLFADDQRLQLAGDLQKNEAPGFSTFYSFERANAPGIDAEPRRDDLSQLVCRVAHAPAIKIERFLIEARQD